MAFETQPRSSKVDGFANFPGILAGEALELLRAECDTFVAREDPRMDAQGVDSLGISHRLAATR